jgi:hypothetical protein
MDNYFKKILYFSIFTLTCLIYIIINSFVYGVMPLTVIFAYCGLLTYIVMSIHILHKEVFTIKKSLK